MAEDFRGENNYFYNAVLNCVEILKKFQSENNREIRNYYTEDVLNPNPPCFVVLVEGSKDELRASQNLTTMKYTVNIALTIWYYYGDLTEQTKRNEITYVLWEISDLLKRNVTLNGFVPKLGIEVTNVRWNPRARGDRILAGGAISVLARKLYRTSVAT